VTGLGVTHRAALVLLLFAAPWSAMSDPRSDYLLHCAGCHRPDGTGLPPDVPSLAGPLGPLVAAPGGRDYLARVPGAAQAPLSDEALAAVLNWVILEFNADSVPPDFVPLSGKEVGASRRQVLADPLRARYQLWASPADS